MRNFVGLPATERAELFRNTAAKQGMPVAIVEKDFWVCWTLDYLFHRSSLRNSLAFKGGTSLSKCFGLISRFSEDIDLILDWRVLGYDLSFPLEARSSTKQDKINKELNIKTEQYLENVFIHEMEDEFKDDLLEDFRLFISSDDRQTIKFEYPKTFSDDSILQEIRLEIGALSAWEPVVIKSVTPYAAEQYPGKFTYPSTEILTVDSIRTFWEKITILHSESHRPLDKPLQLRYSRHYYDVYCLGKSYVKESAFSNLSLLDKVVDIKTKFYHAAWSSYDTARIGTIRLMPQERNFKALYDDYQRMRNMIIGETPEFDEIINYLIELETEINEICCD